MRWSSGRSLSFDSWAATDRLSGTTGQTSGPRSSLEPRLLSSLVGGARMRRTGLLVLAAGLGLAACVHEAARPVTGLHGIRLGTSKDDVRFLQGQPDSSYADSSVWVYHLPGERMFIGFQPDTVRWILSYEVTEQGVAFPFELQPRVGTITFGDRGIDTLLGSPSRVERSSDGTVRFYFYNERNAVFALRHNSVFMVGVFDPRARGPSFGARP
jgi:hypothetical protein